MAIFLSSYSIYVEGLTVKFLGRCSRPPAVKLETGAFKIQDRNGNILTRTFSQTASGKSGCSVTRCGLFACRTYVWIILNMYPGLQPMNCVVINETCFRNPAPSIILKWILNRIGLCGLDSSGSAQVKITLQLVKPNCRNDVEWKYYLLSCLSFGISTGFRTGMSPCSPFNSTLVGPKIWS